MVLDRDWRITYLNSKAKALIGPVPGFDVGAQLWELFPDAVGTAFDRQYRTAMETQKPAVFEEYLPSAGIWAAVHAYPAADSLSLFFHDVTERRKIRQELEFLAHHDGLTGLKNRGVFRRSLEEGLATVSPGSGLAILYLDLDEFKDINDSFGHPAGDALLVQIANRLCACLGEHDSIARMGGDEFAILQRNITSEDETEHLAERILADLSVPWRWRGDFSTWAPA